MDLKLTSEEIIALIKEKTIKKNGVKISSNSSFLAILGLIGEEVEKLDVGPIRS